MLSLPIRLINSKKLLICFFVLTSLGCREDKVNRKSDLNLTSTSDDTSSSGDDTSSSGDDTSSSGGHASSSGGHASSSGGHASSSGGNSGGSTSSSLTGNSSGGGTSGDSDEEESNVSSTGGGTGGTTIPLVLSGSLTFPSSVSSGTVEWDKIGPLLFIRGKVPSLATSREQHISFEYIKNTVANFPGYTSAPHCQVNLSKKATSLPASFAIGVQPDITATNGFTIRSYGAIDAPVLWSCIGSTTYTQSGGTVSLPTLSGSLTFGSAASGVGPAEWKQIGPLLFTSGKYPGVSSSTSRNLGKYIDFDYLYTPLTPGTPSTFPGYSTEPVCQANITAAKITTTGVTTGFYALGAAANTEIGSNYQVPHGFSINPHNITNDTDATWLCIGRPGTRATAAATTVTISSGSVTFSQAASGKGEANWAKIGSLLVARGVVPNLDAGTSQYIDFWYMRNSPGFPGYREEPRCQVTLGSSNNNESNSFGATPNAATSANPDAHKLGFTINSHNAKIGDAIWSCIGTSN